MQMLQKAFNVFSAFESLLGAQRRFFSRLLASEQMHNSPVFLVKKKRDLSSLDKKKFILILDFDTTIRTTGVRL